MISVKNITKKYAKQAACDNVSLNVKPGEIGVLLGPNGAGKSTLIKSVCGLLKYDGEITVNGFNNRSIEAKRILGYVPEFPSLYPMLTVWEHLEFIARAYRLENWENFADELLLRFDMADKKKKLGKELSKGMQQKVSVCCALVTAPQAVVFDEPLVGLDPHGIRELKTVITDLKTEGKAILISTHMIESMEENWDITFIMKNGRIVREIRREDGLLSKLEDIYFSITESEGETGESK
ncbi:MAG: ABC transporter ATP-binding protein [Clostridiales bacterium]|jgi:ABC-type multidrug transport system ATPase subunit|nr:ABC transporter ATP-binding protein [Clostridiales bacterium]